ncbi:uncharacterized protein LOC106880080 [Octopus bimaculoides]|uniref:Uncharacterized protein n=1 Tax=Octopus bimaculoides TaxID=37653 RepID=A0A0L8I8W8_OCTBM|nr:uncharacterized protein LOC106880080 [Octopus bimaculoides]XP_014785396.1 uncharacterized protein LOC106880080 [Octopus bimaculoides]XP_014785406.1 uncharacterized protein LOC106880080 [Octopus bimaculoides]XP_052826239.1 uncharacterized protein LOC106880080 [Octopus bimaculoides]XP_052826241.1 uncharacterized protein LOC106880080 [Octopus bimaculoides]XP_052826242.1 uncharacterized protein LOC106880080 [Octopus bimaculoides]|eukprot:XP_014785383.1 PREDICTED: uncharacterized protein LOC106880080 [Octopus bimaculoides]
MFQSVTKFFTKRNTKHHKRSFDKDYNAANAFILLVTEKMEELSNIKTQTASDRYEIESNENSEQSSDSYSYCDNLNTNDSAVYYKNKNLCDSRSVSATNVRERRKHSSCNKNGSVCENETLQKDIISADKFPANTQVEYDQLNNLHESGCANWDNSKKCISRNNCKFKRRTKVDYSWLFDRKNIPRLNRFDRGKLRECCQLMTYDQSILAYDVLQKLIEDISEPSVIPEILDTIIMYILGQEKESASFKDLFRRRNLTEICWQGYMRPFGLILSALFPKKFKQSPDPDRQNEAIKIASVVKESLMKKCNKVFVNKASTESDVFESPNEAKDINVVYVQRVDQDRGQTSAQKSYGNQQSYKLCKIDKFYFRNSNNILSNSMYRSQICRLQPASRERINSEAQFRRRKRLIKRRSQAVTVRVIRDFNSKP